jgi:glycosyltransferase involved in cell wall biosynthesis
LDAPLLSELQDFTLDNYIKLISFLKQNRRIIPFCDVRYEDTPYLILRHDIDISLQDALTMAKIEKDLGVRSTYFVLLSTPAYNLFEGENIAILKEISEYGHEIGLHYHPAQYRLYKQNPEKTLKIETQILESYLGKKVRSIARHGLFDRDPFSTTQEYINANHPYLRADLFIHDSNRVWATLEGLSVLLSNPPKRVQLLIHPDNWQKDKIDRQTLIERQFKKMENKIRDAKKSLYDVVEKDSFVIDYDKKIKNSNLKQFVQKTSEYKSNFSNRALINYYFLNSKIGWNIAKLRRNIKGTWSFPQFTNQAPNSHLNPSKKISNGQPLVSIIITSYNYGRYLSDAIKSAISQTYSNIEIIVVDDGSTDNTKEVAELFSVKYIYQSNQGVSSAKNTGISQSQGDFLICLDGDDKLFPKYVEKTLDQILKHPSTAFVYTGSVTYDENSRTENIWMPKQLHTKYSLFAGWRGAMGPIMLRKKAYQSLQYGFDTALPVHEDMDLCFRLLNQGWKSDVVFEPIHWYRIHEGSLNPTTREKKRAAGDFMDRKFGFRKNYRRLYALYKKTIGRLESLMRSPIKYLIGLQKKVQVGIEVKQYRGMGLATKEKAQKIQQEINFTIDMKIEWHNNKSLQKYYASKIEFFEEMLKHLASMSTMPKK